MFSYESGDKTFHTLTNVGRKKLLSMCKNVAAFSCSGKVVIVYLKRKGKIHGLSSG